MMNQTRVRAEHLVVGALDALDDRDPTLALQRAFYAYQLLTTGGDR